jgi:diguanylate cyclase (GGDEF)-like protein/PAS domain S-box-containing protein
VTAQSVLLVDDSAFFRNMLAPVLKAAGYKVRVAPSAEEGLSALRSGQIEQETMFRRGRDPSGDSSWDIHGVPVLDRDGRIRGVIEIARDVTERKRAADSLSESERRYRTVADHIYDWESWISPTGEILFVSPSCERISGYPPGRFIDDPAFIEEIIHQEDLPLWRQHMSEDAGPQGRGVDFRIFTASGDVRWISQEWRKVYDEDGRYLGIRTSIRDITDRKLMEQKLSHKALHDPLTNLANRDLCLDRIGQAMERASRRDNYHYAVVFMDLDRFKIFNDSYGHDCGDTLLVEFSRRLSGIMRGLDTAARFGGDEFVILLEELASPREAIRFVKRMREELRTPFLVNGSEVMLTASFGITFCSPDRELPKELLHKANIAMHRAKELGRDRVKVFNRSMLEQAIWHMTLENDLRRGVAREEFYVLYQPICTLPQGELMGFEALVRWDHPKNGPISPDEFISMAEETGIIIDLGQWVLRQACRMMAGWRAGHPEAESLLMSVNLSAKQFTQPNLVQFVADVLEETGLPPERLKLEITETAVMEDAGAAIDKLKRLKALGIKVSIDDFGTGYSSMAHLQRFPIDHLKIDLGFVRKIDTASENLLIVKAIISLAHSLGLKVIAEGIEKEEQAAILADLGCEYGQGYLFAKPVTCLEAELFVARGMRREAAGGGSGEAQPDLGLTPAAG